MEIQTATDVIKNRELYFANKIGIDCSAYFSDALPDLDGKIVKIIGRDRNVSVVQCALHKSKQ
jgi:hypothetical protein